MQSRRARWATTPFEQWNKHRLRIDVEHFTRQSRKIAGVSSGASKVEADVTATDKATLLRAKSHHIEAVPPGQQPTKITPTATSAGKFNNLTKKIGSQRHDNELRRHADKDGFGMTGYNFEI